MQQGKILVAVAAMALVACGNQGESVEVTDQDRRIAGLIAVMCTDSYDCGKPFIRFEGGEIARVVPGVRVGEDELPVNYFRTRYLSGLDLAAQYVHRQGIVEVAIRQVDEERWLELGQMWLQQSLYDHDSSAGYVASWCVGSAPRCADSYIVRSDGTIFHFVEDGHEDIDNNLISHQWLGEMFPEDPYDQREFDREWVELASPEDTNYETLRQAWCFQTQSECV